MPDRITQAPSPNFTNQWVEISNSQHHNLKCITSSKLKFLMDGNSPYSFYQKYVLKTIAQDSNPAFIFGTLAHMAVLEPERFDRTVRICDLNHTTNEYKAFKLKLATPKFSDLTQAQQKALLDKYNESLNQNPGTPKRRKKPIKQDQVFEEVLRQEIENPESLENSDFQETLLQFYEPTNNSDGSFVGSDFEDVFLVKSSDYEIFKGYQESVKNHQNIKKLLPYLIAESSGIAQDPETGLWLALRGDWRCQKKGAFIDVKTIWGPLNESSIRSYVYKYRLQMQAAHYLETANLIEKDHYKIFLFLFLSKEPPYEIALVSLDPSTINSGIQSRREYLNLIKYCEDQNYFPAIDYNGGKNYIEIKLYNNKSW